MCVRVCICMCMMHTCVCPSLSLRVCVLCCIAETTQIDVRLKEYGLRSIEVIDNGNGISPSNFASLALKHFTSKLTAFTDLEKLSSYGFRGEALSSLCAVGTLSVITRDR